MKVTKHPASISTQLSIGFLCISCVIGIKLLFEMTPIGHSFEAVSLEYMQRKLFDTDLDSPQQSVSVINIASIQPERSKITGQVIGTPALELTRVVEKIISMRPKAIGIDIDFGLIDGQPKHASHPAFLEFCSKTMAETKIPIVVGISSSRFGPPETWLGDLKFNKMGGYLGIPRMSYKLPFQFESLEHETPLLGFGWKLAQACGQEAPKSTAWQWIFHPLQQHELPKGHPISRITDYFVDFGSLGDVIKGTIPACSDEVLEAHRASLTDHIVILGDGYAGTEAQATDQFVLLGLRPDPVPGVYLHACGAQTPERGWFNSPTKYGRVLLDFAISGLAIGMVAILKTKLAFSAKRNSKNSEHRINFIVICFTSILVWLVGYELIKSLRLMWSDFILVIIALMIHPACERVLHRAVTRSNHSRLSHPVNRKLGDA